MAVKSKARHDLTLRSIKREIMAGRDVAFWLDRRTPTQTAAFRRDDIAESRSAYYDGLDSAEEPTEQEGEVGRAPARSGPFRWRGTMRADD
ncbi:MAG: hypothetical protein ACLTXI_05610 [Collinsella sp.]